MTDNLDAGMGNDIVERLRGHPADIGLDDLTDLVFQAADEIERLRRPPDVAVRELREALIRAERKLTAYVRVCKDDKELTGTVLPMVRQALGAGEVVMEPVAWRYRYRDIPNDRWKLSSVFMSIENLHPDKIEQEPLYLSSAPTAGEVVDRNAVAETPELVKHIGRAIALEHIGSPFSTEVYEDFARAAIRALSSAPTDAMRCTICGLVVDLRYEAEFPSKLRASNINDGDPNVEA